MSPKRNAKYEAGLAEFRLKFFFQPRILRKIKPTFIILLSFLALVLIGSLLLFLPISSTSGHMPYINCLFLATSAVCVTGLSPITLATDLTVFGKVVMGVLIQMGGLGLVTVISFVLILIGQEFNVSYSALVRESLNQDGIKGIRLIVRRIVTFTLFFELSGAIYFFIFFLNQGMEVGDAIGVGLFHAVSAFNNAGFDIIGDSSIQAFHNDIAFNLVTCFLIIAGGLGFLVHDDIFFTRNPRRYSLQTKIVLLVYFTLAAISFGGVWGLSQLGGTPLTALEAFTYSVNLRTAGFSNIDTTQLSTANVIFSQIFMFIGGNPLSTAGGIKTTTIFIIIMALFNFIRGRNTVIARRVVNQTTRLKAFLLFGFGVVAILIGSVLIGIFNPELGLNQITYEATSAFGTVGFSLNVTPQLRAGSKLVLCFLMYSGRVGPVSYLSLLSDNSLDIGQGKIDYLDANIMVG